MLYLVTAQEPVLWVLEHVSWPTTTEKKEENISGLISYLDLTSCLSSSVTDNSGKLGLRISNLFLILCSQITASPET